MSSFFNMDSPVMRFLSRVCDLMILNLLCLICCIPIITIGASITALYSVTLKMVKGEETYIVKGFFHALKQNFKISTIIWLILAVVGLILAFDFKATQLFQGNMQKVFRILIGAVSTFYLLLLSYVFPYVARFENTIRNSMKNAMLISILNLPYTVAIVLIPILAVLATLINGTTLMYGSLAWILLGISCIALAHSYMFRKVFAKYEPQENEEVIEETEAEAASSLEDSEK